MQFSFIKHLSFLGIAILLSSPANSAAPADSRQLGAALVVAITSPNQANTEGQTQTKSSALENKRQAERSESGSRAAEFIAALREKLDARDKAAVASHRIRTRHDENKSPNEKNG